MNIITHTIDVAELTNALFYLCGDTIEDKKKLVQHLDCINSLLNNSHDLLREMDGIEDSFIQSCFRRAILAQAYGVRVAYKYCRGLYAKSQNFISCCRNQIVVIQTPHNGSVILSKYGGLLVDEGVLLLNDGNFYGPFVTVRKLGQGPTTWGIYSDEGKFVVPFDIFDYIHLSLSVSTLTYRHYEDISFRIVGDLSRLDTDDLIKKQDHDKTSEFVLPNNMVLHIWGLSHYIGKALPEDKKLCPLAVWVENDDGTLTRIELPEDPKLRPLTSEIIQEELDRRNREKKETVKQSHKQSRLCQTFSKWLHILQGRKEKDQ